MVSEKSVLIAVGIVSYALMLSGIFYSESDWLSSCSQRFDLELLQACLIFMAIVCIMAKVPQTTFGRHTATFTFLVYFTGPALLACEGLQMAISLIVWKVESNKSEQLKQAFSKYQLPYVFYWIAAVLLIVVFGWGFVLAVLNDPHIKRVFADFKFWKEVKHQAKKMMRDPWSAEGILSCLMLLEPRFETVWTNHFQRYVFMRYLIEGNSKVVSKVGLDTQGTLCGICDYQLQPAESVIDIRILKPDQSKKPAAGMLAHPECILRSDFASPMDWATISEALAAHLREERLKLIPAQSAILE